MAFTYRWHRTVDARRGRESVEVESERARERDFCGERARANHTTPPSPTTMVRRLVSKREKNVEHMLGKAKENLWLHFERALKPNLPGQGNKKPTTRLRKNFVSKHTTSSKANRAVLIK